jgi:hypothetical protein
MNEATYRREVEGLDDDGLTRLARGIAAVERAVRGRSQAVPLFAGPTPLPPPAVALELGWRLCARCGRPVKPSWAITRAGEVFHPVCIAIALEEAA